MRRLSVLWLVEHLAREMDTACAVIGLLRERHGIDVEIWHLYRDADQVLRDVVPDVVVHPFFYFSTGALATEDFVSCWPAAVHFNLAWEQLHYPAHRATKAPADAFARERVLHHAWGPFYRQYLLEHGVPDEHIFVNGNPACALYADPYRQFYQSRRQLAERYGLDEHARWVFVPENYRWAFVSDKRLATFEDWGGNRAEASELREFSRQSLEMVLRWCREVAAAPGVELIFRTRPSTGEDQMGEFVAGALGDGASSIRFIKRESVREWILSSDVVISSYSTSLIEAALAEKPAFMMEPLPIPAGLLCDWYALVPSVTSLPEFRTACSTSPPGPAAPVATWARQEMLGLGDPIDRLADHVAALARRHRSDRCADGVAIADAARRRLPPRHYFNPRSHDQDAFDQPFIEDRIDAWKRIIEV